MIGQNIGLSSAEEYPRMTLHKIGFGGSGRFNYFKLHVAMAVEVG
jgi:hypothetical protein